MKIFLQNFFFNKPGLFLVLFNFFLFIWGFLAKGGEIDHFHFHYEPLPVKILTIINLPAMFLAEHLEGVLFGYKNEGSSVIFFSNFVIALVILLSCLQWLLIGYLLTLPNKNSVKK